MVRLLGRGTFSQVVQCRDMQAEQQCRAEEDATRVAASGKRSTDVAIKIVRAVDRYRVAAEREARLLQSIDHTRRTMSTATTATNQLSYSVDGCVTLLGSFMLAGHLCLVFPSVGFVVVRFFTIESFSTIVPGTHTSYRLSTAADVCISARRVWCYSCGHQGRDTHGQSYLHCLLPPSPLIRPM